MRVEATPFNRSSELAIEVFTQTLDAVRADRLIESAVKRIGDVLFIQDRPYDLSHYESVWIAGAGKASAPMARALARILGPRLAGGLIVTKAGSAEQVSGVTVLEASHPVPDETSVMAGERLLDFAASRGYGDLVLFVLSGGASALAEAPGDGVTLETLRKVNRDLLASGKDIVQMNRVRSQYSRIKGGRLGRAFEPAAVVALVLSDVLGNVLAAIGSGPLIDPEVRAQPIEHFVIGSLSLAIHEAAAAAARLGLRPLPFGDPIKGEAKAAAQKIAKYVREHGASGSCFIFGGEPTVTLSGAGLGGRCQEMACAAARIVAQMPGSCFLAAGTDGVDGPTDAAGGIVDSESIKRTNMSVTKALKEHNSYRWLESSGGLIKTGPTGSNVNDVVMIVQA